MNKTFAVIGLGTFGQQLCESIVDESSNIMAIDIDEKAVNKVASFIPHAICCDCTREENLSQLGLNNIDHVIIAIGSNIQATILCTVILKQIGVKNLTVRVDDSYYVPIIKKLGADNIVNPQKLAVQSLSTSLLSRSFTDFYEITENYGVAQLIIEQVQDKKTLQEMNIRGKFNVNILLIKRKGKTFVPSNSDLFFIGDEIIIFGSKHSISKLDHFLSEL
jgi:trk system potassium uptake protein TrkA